MKKISIFLLLAIWLTACLPQVKIESTPISILTPTQTQTVIPSPTNKPTLTPTITFTPTATLEPSEITFNIGESVPSQDIQDIQTGIERIRVYLRDYMGGDISPEIRKKSVVTIVAAGENRTSALDESGIHLWFDVKGIEWARTGSYSTPFQTLSDEHIKTAPHEYIHGWQSSLGCLGYHYNKLGWWMSEGIAEYIATETAFQYNLVKKDAIVKFMLQSAEGTENSVSLQSLESTYSKFWPGHIGYLGIDYLVSKSPNGIFSLRIVCEEAGKGVSADRAFKDAFGISKQDFYKEFQQYIGGIYALTPQPSIDTGIGGNVVWDSSYPNKGFDKYILNFCPIKGGNCLGGTSIQPDGTFFQSLSPGYYRISLNFKDGERQLLGWYSSKGMVKENSCSALVQVVDNKITEIDFKVNSPILCR